MRLIDADALRQSMYHEAFETDSPMQKWDSGCWIRYKMFENAIDSAPTIDAVPVVRCKDCRWKTDFKHTAWCPCDEMAVNDNWYCANGERK